MLKSGECIVPDAALEALAQRNFVLPYKERPLMPSKWRRFEVLIPLQWNDGQEIPEELLGEAVFEILDQFTGVGFENLNVVGHWLHEGTV